MVPPLPAEDAADVLPDELFEQQQFFDILKTPVLILCEDCNIFTEYLKENF
ncbi:MAG: hypothetical protein LBS87_03045 [Puniceicoccales bacterium]|jgi:hypothetical protein|nr:hypothetical protein [Puniceicoccales bacterium]